MLFPIAKTSCCYSLVSYKDRVETFVQNVQEIENCQHFKCSSLFVHLKRWLLSISLAGKLDCQVRC